MEDSYIGVRDGRAQSFVGRDAVELFAATSLKAAIGMYANSGGKLKASRMRTRANMLKAATRYTGKAYKQSWGGLNDAAYDLQVWCDEMAAALPKVEGK